MFRSFDQDSSGYLNFSEFIIAYASTSNSEVTKKVSFFLFFHIPGKNKILFSFLNIKLDFVFSFYDKNKDGFISYREFQNGVKCIQKFKNTTKKENNVKDIFKKIDKDKDEQLSKEEFLEACMSNEQILSLLSPFEL